MCLAWVLVPTIVSALACVQLAVVPRSLQSPVNDEVQLGPASLTSAGDERPPRARRRRLGAEAALVNR